MKKTIQQQQTNKDHLVLHLMCTDCVVKLCCAEEDMQKEVEMQNTEFITLKIAKKDTYITEKVV